MAKKKTKKDIKRNDSKDLVPMDVAEEVVSKVLVGKATKRVDKYFLFRMLGIPAGVAAKSCNYHEAYGYMLDKKFRDNLNLQTRIAKITGQIPNQYKNLCKLRLVELAEIEGAALDEYRKDPKLLIDKPQLAKQLKISGGVIGDENQPRQQTVNIKAVQNIMLQAHRKSADDVIEGELEEE